MTTESLIAPELTNIWGVDTTEAEFWMFQNFVDNPSELHKRTTPLSHEEAWQQFTSGREAALKKMQSFDFPDEYLKFRGDCAD